MEQRAIEAPQKATSREWIGLAVLALPCILYSMDLTVLNLAVPHLMADLRPSSAELLWIVDIYGFMIAGSLITMGTLGDRIGRRKLLMFGAAAFGVASVIAAFANSVETLIAARALLGIAGATLAPSTLSLIRNMFQDDAERTFAIGMWVMSYSAGGAIGPVLGGVMLEYFWWGSVFLLAVPVMILLLATAPFLLPEYRDPQCGRLDILSAGLSLVAVLSVIWGLKTTAEGGNFGAAAVAVVAGLLVGWLFVRRQRTLEDPLIDLKLFQKPAFTAAVAVNIFGVFIAFASFMFTAQYLQLVLGLSPLMAGLWSLPGALGFIVASFVAPAISQKLGPARTIAVGLTIVALSFLLLTQVDTYGLPAIVVATVAMSFGLSPVFILTTDLIVSSAPPERAGAAAAISETGAEFGGVLGIAVLGSVGIAIYRSMMALPSLDGIPPDALETARDTLGAAIAASAELAPPAGPLLIETARNAFITGFEVIVILCAIIALATAFLSTRYLRRVEAAPAE
jgi:DHA2 family multidrug resistance protein-like MFS transporter